MTAPAGAIVVIDNVSRGVTPWTGELIPGPHTLALRLAGYREAVSEIELPAEHAIDIDDAAGSRARARARERHGARHRERRFCPHRVERVRPRCPLQRRPWTGSPEPRAGGRGRCSAAPLPRWPALAPSSSCALASRNQARESQIQIEHQQKFESMAGPADRRARIPRASVSWRPSREGCRSISTFGTRRRPLRTSPSTVPRWAARSRRKDDFGHVSALVGVIGGLWVGSVAGGCTSDLELSLDDKLCNADDRCLDDYQCNLQTRRCIPRGQLPVGGGGTSGRGGSTGGLGAASGNGGTGEGGDSVRRPLRQRGRQRRRRQREWRGCAGGEQPIDPDAGLDPSRRGRRVRTDDGVPR